MKILAVDTALGACSAAVLQDDRSCAHRFVAMERGHAEVLAPMVQEAMAEAGLAFADLDRLAVTTGPGTFTGQRVGLAFMRGLRIALKRPLIGITTLEAMAAAAMTETAASHAAVLHDARRSEVYFALYAARRRDCRALSACLRRRRRRNPSAFGARFIGVCRHCGPSRMRTISTIWPRGAGEFDHPTRCAMGRQTGAARARIE